MLKKLILENQRRKEIYDFLVSNPGFHMRGMQRKLKLPLTSLEYHLDYMVRKKLLIRERDGRFTRFYTNFLDEKDEVAGVISDRDVLKALSPYLDTISEQERDLATLTRKAHQIMTRQLVTASPEDTIEDAAGLLLKNRISCLPIITDDRVLAGIVTWKDILKNLMDRPAR